MGTCHAMLMRLGVVCPLPAWTGTFYLCVVPRTPCLSCCHVCMRVHIGSDKKSTQQTVKSALATLQRTGQGREGWNTIEAA